MIFILAEALISALTREISLIEGPPGTRKTVINNENIVGPFVEIMSLVRPQMAQPNLNSIRSIGPRIIVCEETGEVLKAHILSAFTLQLRRTLYPKLIDGENTGKYPNIRDAQYNVYFINHRHPEDSGGDLAMQSHVNKYEVEMVVETRRTKLEEIERRVDGTNNRNEKANSSENKECISLVNFELMASESKDMWATVIKILDEQNQIGDGMPVCQSYVINIMISSA
ncbi:15875_t:CDS:2 [Funneliformis geosporum]|nr:15875_t:CDS:2 [Funneliformis geosporum]